MFEMLTQRFRVQGAPRLHVVVLTGSAWALRWLLDHVSSSNLTESQTPMAEDEDELGPEEVRNQATHERVGTAATYAIMLLTGIHLLVSTVYVFLFVIHNLVGTVYFSWAEGWEVFLTFYFSVATPWLINYTGMKMDVLTADKKALKREMCKLDGGSPRIGALSIFGGCV